MARYPEKFLRADWPSDATWVHEMLDATDSLTVQESTLPQSRLLRSPCSEGLLQAHWLHVTNWIHEMLDSAASMTVRKSSLTGPWPLSAQYAEDFLQVDWPSDASWVHEIVDAKGSLTAVESKLPGSRRLAAGPFELLVPESYLWVVAERGRADFGQAIDGVLLSNPATGRAFTLKGVILKEDEEVFVERVSIWTGFGADEGSIVEEISQAETIPEPACSHQMLDATGSLTVQESSLPQSRVLMACYPEKFLRADWPSDATWVHEMLDATG
ncbi:hypothetical protein AK812_SmicGene46903, partial [Symbiodinium microadriaticum]